MAKSRLPEALRSREEQIQYLLYLQSEIPTLFEQGAEYDVNFLSLIEDQNTLLAEFKKNREYMSMMLKRPPHAEIRINLSETKKNLTKVFQIQALQEAFETAGLKDDEKFQYKWNELMSRVVDAQNLSGLMTGIIGLYPAELKAQGFKIKTNVERLEFLRANPLDNSILRSKFKGERYGLDSDKLKWSEVLKTAQLWSRIELEIADRILNECKNKNNSDDCAAVFEGGELWTEVTEPLDIPRDQYAALGKIRESLLNQFSSKQQSTPSQIETVPALKLVEVPPHIGVFRGLVGGDCSTSMTFSFVYMPNERTYFVYSTGGHIMGYVQGTVVKSGNRDHLYIHSISGNELSHRHVQLALHGLAKSASQLGFEKLLLPTREAIHRNINYVSIHRMLNPLLLNPQVPLSYPDEELRQWLVTIKTLNSVGSGYDSGRVNPVAHHIRLNNDLLEQIQVEISDSNFPTDLKLRRTLSKSDAILMALDLLAGQQSDVARATLHDAIEQVRAGVQQAGSVNFSYRHQTATQILEPFGLTLREDGTLPIHDLLTNRNHQNVKEYYLHIKGALRAYGIELDDELIERRPYLFNEGHLMASDAITTEDKVMRKRTLEAVASLIRRWPKPPSLALKAISTSPSMFQQSAPMQKLVMQLARGPVSDYFKLRALKGAGIDLGAMNSEALTEAVELKLKEPGLNDSERKVVMEIWNAVSGSRCETLLKGA